ncbi:MAG TPA: hypothetical protein VMT00_09940 [Thermoanaerobaculia bacterium]|nr:hypothetical protein [Thermoanaerobaculia bacterium]
MPESIADHEDLARILRSSSHFSASGVKAAAFMPAKDGRTSVIRHGSEPRHSLWSVGAQVLGTPVRHGAAICGTSAIRRERLDVLADEPPLRHANIVGWPTNADAELQKAQQKELALAIAAKSTLVRLDE